MSTLCSITQRRIFIVGQQQTHSCFAYSCNVTAASTTPSYDIMDNGSAAMEGEKQKTSSHDMKRQHFIAERVSQLLRLMYKPGSREEDCADFSERQQIKMKLSVCQDSVRVWFRQLDHYFSLLCFLLTMITLLLSLCLVQVTTLFWSQSMQQETKVRDLTIRLERLNQSYQLLFSQYPALNQYCPIGNASTGERECRPCPAGWTSQGDKCFLFTQDRADWISSQYRCMAAGGAVATVRTEDEQLFLWKTAQSLSQGDSYWLGLRSSTDGGWKWRDGSPAEKGPQFWFRERAPGEAADGKELCVRLGPIDDYKRSWFTSGCSTQLRRICERRQAALQ